MAAKGAKSVTPKLQALQGTLFSALQTDLAAGADLRTFLNRVAWKNFHDALIEPANPAEDATEFVTHPGDYFDILAVIENDLLALDEEQELNAFLAPEAKREEGLDAKTPSPKIQSIIVILAKISAVKYALLDTLFQNNAIPSTNTLTRIINTHFNPEKRSQEASYYYHATALTNDKPQNYNNYTTMVTTVLQTVRQYLQKNMESLSKNDQVDKQALGTAFVSLPDLPHLPPPTPLRWKWPAAILLTLAGGALTFVTGGAVAIVLAPVATFFLSKALQDEEGSRNQNFAKNLLAGAGLVVGAMALVAMVGTSVALFGLTITVGWPLAAAAMVGMTLSTFAANYLGNAENTTTTRDAIIGSLAFLGAAAALTAGIVTGALPAALLASLVVMTVIAPFYLGYRLYQAYQERDAVRKFSGGGDDGGLPPTEEPSAELSSEAAADLEADLEADADNDADNQAAYLAADSAANGVAHSRASVVTWKPGDSLPAPTPGRPEAGDGATTVFRPKDM